jgi:hypothetical protein
MLFAYVRFLFLAFILLPYVSICENVKWYIPFSNESGALLVNVRINDTVNAILQIDNGCNEVQLNQNFIDKYTQILGFKEHPIRLLSTLAYDNLHIAECDIYFSFGDSIVQYTNTSGYVTTDESTKRKHIIAQFVEVYNDKNSLDIFGRKVENSISNVLNIKADGVFPLRLFAEKGIIKINNTKSRIEFVDEIDNSSVIYPFEWSFKTQIVKYPISFIDDIGKEHKYTFNTLLDLGYNGFLALFNNNRTKPMWWHLERNNEKLNQVSLKNAKLGKDSIIYNMCVVAKINQSLVVDLIAGVIVLSNYDIYFDYKKQIIALKHLTTKTKATVGFNVATSHKGHIYTVSFVDKKNCVFDLLVGDTLYKIGETIVNEEKFPNEIKPLLYDISNTTIVVKRKDEYIVLNRKQKE